MLKDDIDNKAFSAYSKIQSLLDLSPTDISVSTKDANLWNMTSLAPYDDILRVTNNYIDVTNKNALTNTSFPESKTFNEESFESKLHPDENIFHHLVQEMMQKYEEGMRGLPSPDHFAHSQIAGRYALAINDIYNETLRESAKYGIDSFAGDDLNNLDMMLYGRSQQTKPNQKFQILQRDLRLYRAERDLWTLLESLSYSNLLMDLDESSCERNLSKEIRELPISASIPDYINAAYRSDDRFRKGALLKEWIEKAAVDRVSEIPIPKSEPYGETLIRILKNKRFRIQDMNILQSVHPDAQLQGNKMLSLDNADRIDQESSLKMIWQLLRSGQLERAQQICTEHHLYWLTASLQGVAAPLYRNIGSAPTDSEHIDCEENELTGDAILIGNLKQPCWVRTCWKYADKLAADSINKNGQIYSIQRDASLVGLLEMSIYACLSNNIKVLLNSPLLSCWHDKLWVYLKATHERDISFVLQEYRIAKSNFSSLYPGCDMNTIHAEKQTLELILPDIGHLSNGTCFQIFSKVPPPANDNDTESLILSLQAAVMEGKSGILNYLENVMSKYLQSPLYFSGKEAILRVSCHFSIWLKYAPINDITNLSDIISDDLFHLAVESYIEYLINQKQRSLVAVYAAYLSRPRRVIKYAQLLNSMQISSAGFNAFKYQQGKSVLQNDDAADVLHLAKVFFPSDVIDITRAVIENYSHIVDQPVEDNKFEITGRNISREQQSNEIAVVKINRSALKNSGSGFKPRSLRTPSQLPFVKKNSLSSHRIPVISSKYNSLDLSSYVSNEDKLKMDSLRWLFYDPIYRLEAIKQANRLIVKFLSTENSLTGGYELKVSPVRMLLMDYIPLDSIETGYAILESRKHSLDDTALSLLNSVNLETEVWTAQVAKLQLWTSFTNSLQDLEIYHQVVLEYEAVSSRLLVEISSVEDVRSNLGKFRSKIIRTASIATDSIKSAIICSKLIANFTSQDEHVQENVSDGYKEIWILSENSSRQYVVSAIKQFKDFLKYNEDNFRSDTMLLQQYDWLEIKNNLLILNDIANSLTYFIDTSTVQVVDEIKLLIHELLTLITSLAIIEDGNQHGIQTPSHIKKPLLSTPMTSGTPATKVSNDTSISVVNSLKECQFYLLDIKEGNQLAAILLTQLLSSYIQTCLSTAAILDSLSYQHDAVVWYGKVVQLAELIASEDHSLQLYSILDRDDLEALLLSIKSASISLLTANADLDTL